MAKVQYAITYFFIGIVVLACVMGMFSCNPQKRAVKKLATIDSKHKKVMDGYFAMTRPCTDSVHEVYINDTIVRPSETKYITLDIDSLINSILPNPENCDSLLWETKKRLSLGKGDKVNLPCPPCDSTWIINTYKSKYEKQTDKSKLGELQAINQQLRDERDKARISEARKQKALSIALWAAIILGIYTIGRWVLRIWKIKLP